MQRTVIPKAVSERRAAVVASIPGTAQLLRGENGKEGGRDELYQYPSDFHERLSGLVGPYSPKL